MRTILHADANSFYASVECLHHPEIRDRAVAVGGDASLRHGIILAKNERAKAMGVKTGEALWQARQKCPNLLILKPNFSLYLRFSRLLREMFYEYSDLVEPFGLDEAWIDVTGSTGLFGGGYKIAEQIRRRVKDELGITVSVGVANNKIFAKLASDMKKPDAVTNITESNYKELVWPLPASDLLYVGPSTTRKLRRYGVNTIGDIATADSGFLHRLLGKTGYILHGFANGLDSSPVEQLGEEAVIKSIGNSTTTPRDLVCEEDVRIICWPLSESVASRLRKHGFVCRGIQISVRDNSLFSFERQCQLERPSALSYDIFDSAMTLFKNNYDWANPIRSFGVRAINLVGSDTAVQTSLFEDEERRQKRERLDLAVEDIRMRFGHSSIRRAIILQDHTLSGLNPSEHTIHPVGYFKPTN
ncbi:MAG: DNA polymerase IV [Clostridiales bacterium]|nr:DNA polymerase IV [Clostridiales bacterium]